MNQAELDKMLSRAKIGIMEKPDTIFFSTLCSSLETIFTEEYDTAATNGIKLLINPVFFSKLTLPERVFLLAHETLHVAYLHTIRCEDRNPEIWNMAADYVINLELVERGFTFIGDLRSRGIDFPGGLLDKQYAGMSTEEVYKKLLDDAQQNPLPQLSMKDIIPTGSEKGEGGESGKGSVNQGIAEAARAEVQAKISRAIMIAEMSQQAGGIPPSIKRYFSDLTKPKINWKAVLQRFVATLTNDNYSWQRPNKRLLPTYLPKLHSQTLGRLDFAIDTSGSITKEQFTQFVSEVHAVLRMLKPKEIGVYQFDHKLEGSNVVRKVTDILTIPFSGGGGTRPQCAIDEFKKNKALGLIILTDGYFHKSLLTDPKRPVIWVVYDNPNFVPPFGSVVHFELRSLN